MLLSNHTTLVVHRYKNPVETARTGMLHHEYVTIYNTLSIYILHEYATLAFRNTK